VAAGRVSLLVGGSWGELGYAEHSAPLHDALGTLDEAQGAGRLRPAAPAPARRSSA